MPSIAAGGMAGSGLEKVAVIDFDGPPAGGEYWVSSHLVARVEG